MMKKQKRRIYYVFSPFLRIFHWMMVASLLALFITGLMITKPVGVSAMEPTYSTLSVDFIRNIHFIAAFIFTSSIMLRIYGFIINPGDRLMPRVWEGSFYKGFFQVALHYMFLKLQHPPFLRNPMARLSYGGFYAMAFIEIVTGFAMYAMDFSGIWGFVFGSVNVTSGGVFMVHLIHHYVAWFIVLVAIGHVYMVVRADVMEGEGEASSMFSGIKLYKHRPLEVMELEQEAHTQEYWDALKRQQWEDGKNV